jgi:hypothetical protein
MNLHTELQVYFIKTSTKPKKNMKLSKKLHLFTLTETTMFLHFHDNWQPFYIVLQNLRGI